MRGALGDLANRARDFDVTPAVFRRYLRGAMSRPPEGSAGYEAQVRLVENFTKFRWALTDLFAGKPVPNFYLHMVTLAGNILACWQNGAVPTFSRQAGSVSIANTSAAGAAYVAVCWNLMALILT